MYVDRSREYINRSQTHKCGNLDWGRVIPFLVIHKWDFRCSADSEAAVAVTAVAGAGVVAAGATGAGKLIPGAGVAATGAGVAISCAASRTFAGSGGRKRERLLEVVFYKFNFGFVFFTFLKMIADRCPLPRIMFLSLWYGTHIHKIHNWGWTLLVSQLTVDDISLAGPRKQNWARVCKLLKSPGIDSASLISLAGRYDRVVVPAG